jgi:uncharacterized membrane protein
VSVSDERAEQRIEVMLGNLLRYGVLLAAAVTAVGGVVYLYRHGDERADYARFDGAATEKLRSPRGIVEESLRGRGRALVQLGVLLLIATPVARVAFSALAFARQRDYTYVALTLFVLAVLLCSLFVGGG